MYKMTVNYKNFNDEPVEKDVYFHMFDVDAMRLIANKGIGFGTYLERIAKETNFAHLVGIMEELVQISYGVKSDDGEEFDKSPDILARFMRTPAYSECYMRLATDASVAVEFVKNLFPKQLLDRLEKLDVEQMKKDQQDALAKMGAESGFPLVGDAPKRVLVEGQ